MQTVLVTGSKSGIGRGLLSEYAARSDTYAIAAIRDGESSPVAKELKNIKTGTRSKVIVVTYDASSPTGAIDMVAELKEKHNIETLDIVIANAGILKHYGPGSKVSSETMQEHFQINTLAPVLLYQSTAELLNASKNTPKFFIISSSLGSNTLLPQLPMPMIAYGVSKAAVNFAAGKMHQEEAKIVVVPVHPGWVQTEMGNRAAEMNGLTPQDVPVTLDQSVKGLIAVFDKATKEEHSGRFFNHDGEIMPW